MEITLTLFRNSALIAALSLTVGYLLFIRFQCNNAIKVYNETKKANEALEKYEGMNITMINIVLRKAPIIFAYIAVLFTLNIDFTHRPAWVVPILAIILTFILYVFFYDIAETLIRYKADSVIKNLTQSRMSRIRDALIKSIYIYRGIPAIIAVSLSAYVIFTFPTDILYSVGIVGRFANIGIRIIALVAVFQIGYIVLTYYVIPYFSVLKLNPRFMQDKDLLGFFLKIASKNNVSKLGLFVTDVEGISSDHAFSQQLLTNKIFFSKFFLTTLPLDELEAVFMHELAHIKFGHLSKRAKASWKYYFLNILFLTSLFIVVGIPNNFINMGSEHDVIVDGVSIAVVLFIYLAVLLIKGKVLGYGSLFADFERYIEDEKEADEFVIRSGIDAKLYLSFLEKYGDLSEPPIMTVLPVSWEVFANKLSTHPSLENRIKYIREFAESMRKQNDVQEISLHKTT